MKGDGRSTLGRFAKKGPHWRAGGKASGSKADVPSAFGPLDLGRVCRVAVSRRGVVRDMLLHPEMPLEDVHECLRAIFPDVETPIALKNEADTLFPLSLLARHPDAFSAARKVHAHAHVHASSLELVCLGDPDVSYAELTRSLRVGWHDEPSAPTLDLAAYTLGQLVDAFRAAAPTGALDRNSFVKCLTTLTHHSDDHDVFARFFDVFDADRNGVVDVVEFVSGLSVLVHGDRDEKIASTFALYDTNGDGYISLDEMTTYLTSVYLVVAELNPAVFLSNRVDPIQLGHITARQCFEEADLNHDGKLSFHEFQQWYARTNHHAPQHGRALKLLNQKQTHLHASHPIQIKYTLEAVRDMTGLGDYDVDEMRGLFPHPEALTRASFVATLQRLLQRQRKPVPVATTALLERLFDLFEDAPGDVVTGLSVLCAPDVDAVFDLVDANGDGAISRDEMTRYLVAIFTVLAGVTNVHVPLDPRVLAQCTAAQMFADFDSNRDGILSRLEFQAWYLTPTAFVPKPPPLFPDHPAIGALATSPAALSLDAVGRVTNLSTRHPLDVFETLASFVNSDGVLDRPAFAHAFHQLLAGGSASPAQVRDVVGRLFRAFDTDGNGVVDFCELSSGLSLLCAGSQAEKVHAAFTLYDVNKDGYISMPEMVSYLTAVFRVLHAFSATPLPLAPEHLAEVTAADAFWGYDRNRDGQLSLDEFTQWYSTPVPSAPPAPPAGPPAAPPVHHGTRSFDFEFLREARRLTCLGHYAVTDIFAFFQASAKDGVLTKAQFFRCFNKLLNKTTTAPQPTIKATLDRLFVLFDTDGNGAVDTKELAAGLSLLCGGSADEKVAAAFSLFDTNGDGFISPDEMNTYLTAAFKVIFETAPDVPRQLGTNSPSALAEATTAFCFGTCDTNGDGKLSLDEFRVWYRDPGAPRPPAPVPAPVPTPTPAQVYSIPDAQALLGMHALSTRALIRTLGKVVHKPISLDTIYDVIAAQAAPAKGDIKRVKDLAQRIFVGLTAAFPSRLTWSDVICGLSVLTQDASQTDKVQAVFGLIDRNGDGRLSKLELVRYFTAVFAVMYVLEPHKQAVLGGISAPELADVTAATTMKEADTNHDDAISFDEFQRWYTKAHPETAAPLTLQDFRRVTTLGSLDVDEVFERFADYADDHGLISFERFQACLVDLVGAPMPPSLPEMAHRLFHAFDQDHSQRVDFSELASGLSVLCKGSRDLKVQAAFSLYDFNGDGFISMDEMTRYLTSVFRVLYEISPQMVLETGVSAGELGAATAHQAFLEADTNHDGRLSLTEFTQWYKKPLNVEALAVATGKQLTLEQLKQSTHLVHHSAEAVFELFAEAANEDGNLNKAAFDACFAQLIPGAKPAGVDAFLDRLFNLFDHDRTGWVDFAALSSGLSILCGGSKEDKVKAAFALFDFNGDGFISQDEMTRYLTSVFQVLFEVRDHDHSQLGVTPIELATVTAQQAFEEADLNHDGKISLDEFKRWYQQPTEEDDAAHPRVSEYLFSLREARRLTKLERFPADDVFEVLAEAANEDGNLTQAAFTQCFETHFLLDPRSDDARAHAVLDRLFSIFDADGNGVVDFSEITAGLTLLCGGARKEKIQAAFTLYDFNHDGYIAMDEMTRYLTAVFTVLFETDRSLATKMGVTPAELAQVTAEQAFVDCDADHDGRLSLDEFEAWYTQANALSALTSGVASPTGETNAWQSPAKVPLPSLAQVRRWTNLHAFPPAHVVARFRRAAHATGKLTSRDFSDCLVGFANTPEDAARVADVADRLFAVFDTDGNGFVDFTELGAGLSILCGGTHDDKVKAAFELYDLNHDGVISLDEMTQYLTSVFKVVYETNPRTHGALDASPEELARITAEQCFDEADLNHDGKLTMDEFVLWYSKASDASAVLKATSDTSSARAIAGSEAPDACDDDDGQDDPLDPARAGGMERIRSLLKLDQYEVGDLFEIFAEAAPSGELTFAAFRQCFDHLVELAGGYASAQAKQEASVVVRRLFRAFDADENNAVDFGELASGLSVLSGSTMDDKVLAAFRLYDINGDGFISLDEMISYMTSIFKVMYETSDRAKDKMGVPPEELARVTATQCFKDADLDHDARLSFDEFKVWCTSSM